MFANETKARAYIAEVTGLPTGRVIASFPHSISFEVPSMNAERRQEILERVQATFPQATNLAEVCIAPGRYLAVTISAVSLYQKLEFSANVIDCIHQTWQALAEEGITDDNAEAIELVLDANRMETNCGEPGKRADSEIDALTDVFGYAKVDAALTKKVQLV